MRIGIIGAGPVGIYLSKLCLDKDLEVTLIEAGGLAKESQHLNRSKYIFATQSAMPEGVHKIGGGSNLWRGRVSEFITEDFTRKFETLNCSWPFEKDELLPYYKKVYKFLEVGDLSDSDLVLRRFPDLANSMPTEISLRCFRYCKPDFFINLFDSIKNHPNLEVLYEHFCESVSQDHASDRVSVRIAPSNSQTFFRQFDKVVLTCGSLQTTALLMRSEDLTTKLHYPALGKYLSEHIEGYIGTVTIRNKIEKDFFEKISLDEHNKTSNEFHGLGFALYLKSAQGEETLNVQYEFRKLMPRPYLFENLRFKQSGVNIFFQNIFKIMLLGEKIIFANLRILQKIIRRILRKNKYSIYIKSEEIPFKESEIKIDKLNKSVVKYNHKIIENTFILLYDNIFKFQSIFNNYFDAKIELNKKILHIKNFKNFFGPNWHPMGTTRIGDDLQTSVCDSNLNIHNVKNIHILSSSVFPSVSNTNPTFTVLALGERLVSSKNFSK